VVASETAVVEPEAPRPELTESETPEPEPSGQEPFALPERPAASGQPAASEEPTVSDVEVPEATGTEIPDTVHIESDDEVSAESDVELDTEPESDPADEDRADEGGDVDLDDGRFTSFDDEAEVGDTVEAVDTVDTVEAVDTTEAVDTIDTVDTSDTIDTIEAVDTTEAGPVSGADAGIETSPDIEDEVAPVPTGFQFGQRDPHDKARRLARVLVSDMITYNPDRHAQALTRGTLADDFEDEIAKSWEEYVDQVGRDMAESTDYWTNALNDVLARGRKLF